MNAKHAYDIGVGLGTLKQASGASIKAVPSKMPPSYAKAKLKKPTKPRAKKPVIIDPLTDMINEQLRKKFEEYEARSKSRKQGSRKANMIKAALDVTDMLRFPEARRALTEYGILAPAGAKLNAGLVEPTMGALQKYGPRHAQLVQGIRARQAAGLPLRQTQQMYAELMATPVKGGVAQFGPRFGGATQAAQAAPVTQAAAAAPKASWMRRLLQGGRKWWSAAPRWGRLGLIGGGLAALGLGGYTLWDWLRDKQQPQQAARPQGLQIV